MRNPSGTSLDWFPPDWTSQRSRVTGNTSSTRVYSPARIPEKSKKERKGSKKLMQT